MAIAKGLLTRSGCDLDEPTRGVDVGAKKKFAIDQQIQTRRVKHYFGFLGNAGGLGMSDRILVMREGRSSAEFHVR